MRGPVDRYIQHCTRGLPGQTGRLVALELRGHIAQRTEEWMLQGMDRQQAELRTLEELGAPGNLGRGLQWVHWQPLTLRAALVVLFVLALSPSLQRASLPTLALSAEAFIERQHIHNLLDQLGMPGQDLPQQPTNPNLLPANQTIKTPMLHWNAQQFVNVAYLLKALQQAGPVTVQGWEQPTLSTRGAKVHLGSQEQPVTARPIYVQALQDWLDQQTEQPVYFRNSEALSEVQFRYGMKTPASGEVFALVTAMSTYGGVLFSMDVQPRGEGDLLFHLNGFASHVQLQSSWEDFLQAAQHAPHSGRPGNPLPAVLVQVPSTLGDPHPVIPGTEVLEGEP